jgi:hypothetical protein
MMSTNRVRRVFGLAAATITVALGAAGVALATPAEPTPTAVPSSTRTDPSPDTQLVAATTTVDSSRVDSIGESARPVVQLTVQGMFPVEPPFLGDGPMTVIYDDGSVLVSFRGSFCCQPQVWPYEFGHVEPADVEDLLATAGDVGLLAEPDPYAPTNIVDAARTTLVLDTPGGVYTHVADGLHDGDEPDPRRAALQGFIGEIVSLTESVEVGEAFYAPTRVAIVAAPIETTPGMVVEWPDARVSLAGAVACTPVTDPAAVEAVNSALAGTGFRQDGITYVLAARILPPGIDC